MEESFFTWSATFCMASVHLSALDLPAIRSAVAACAALSRSAYQSLNFHWMMFFPAAFIALLADVSAVESVTASPAPLTQGSEWVSDANFDEPALESMDRRN